MRFRSSPKWQKKRKKIKERDNYLCQICIRDLYNTTVRYNYDDVQVHHAVPIHQDDSLKLKSDNLITLCSMHHAMCDRGEIPYEEVKKIIDEQENEVK